MSEEQKGFSPAKAPVKGLFVIGQVQASERLPGKEGKPERLHLFVNFVGNKDKPLKVQVPVETFDKYPLGADFSLQLSYTLNNGWLTFFPA